MCYTKNLVLTDSFEQAVQTQHLKIQNHLNFHLLYNVVHKYIKELSVIKPALNALWLELCNHQNKVRLIRALLITNLKKLWR